MAGSQKSPKSLAPIALSMVALVLTVRWIVDSEPSTLVTATELIATSAVNNPLKSVKTKNGRSLSIDPTLNVARLEMSEGRVYEGTGKNIFSAAFEESGQKTPPQQDPPPPVPPITHRTAEIRLRFFGFVIQPNTPKSVFLSLDGDIFVGHEGEILDRRYKIIGVAPESVEVEDMLEMGTHILALQQG